MKARLKLIRKRLKAGGILPLLIGLFVLVVCWERIVITIPPGHGGVHWYLLYGGTRAAPGALNEGVHVIFPWNRIYDYDMRMQSKKFKYDAVTRDGLHVSIGVSVRWRVNPDRLGRLHQSFGPQYADTLVDPAVGSIARHVLSNYDVDALISERRNDIQSAIFAQVTAESIPNGIARAAGPHGPNTVLLEDILITSVELPENVRTAIESKLQQAQLVDEYRYRVDRERLESDRKAVEAEGIRRFQQIVSSNMTPSYLRWRGIEATLELAQSPNSKVVVIGNQQSGGMPLILDGASSPVIRPPTTRNSESRSEQSGTVEGPRTSQIAESQPSSNN